MNRTHNSTTIGGVVATLLAVCVSIPTACAWEVLSDDELAATKGSLTLPCGKQCEGPPCASDAPCALMTPPQNGCERRVALEIGMCRDCFLVHPTIPPQCACPECDDTEEQDAQLLYRGWSERDEQTQEYYCKDPCPNYQYVSQTCDGCYYGSTA